MFCKHFVILSYVFGLGLVARVQAAPAERLILWHNLKPVQEEVIKDSWRRLQPTPKTEIMLERIEDLAFALIKARSIQRLPDAVLGPSDLVGLRRDLHFSQVPAQWLPPMLRHAIQKGSPLYGIKILGGNHLMLFYNKALLAQAPESFEAIGALAQTRPGPLLAWDYMAPYYFFPFLHRFGGRLVASTGAQRTPQLCHPHVVRALESYLHLLSQSWTASGCDHDCALELFFTEQVPMILSGDWSLSEAQRIMGPRLGLRALPSFAGKPLPPLALGWSLYFPGNSLDGPRRDGLRQLMDLLISKKVQAGFKANNMIPAVEAWQGPPSEGSVADLWQTSHQLSRQGRPLDDPERMTRLWHVLSRGLRLAIKGRSSVSQACQRMQDLAQKAFQEQDRRQVP